MALRHHALAAALVAVLASASAANAGIIAFDITLNNVAVYDNNGELASSTPANIQFLQTFAVSLPPPGTSLYRFNSYEGIYNSARNELSTTTGAESSPFDPTLQAAANFTAPPPAASGSLLMQQIRGFWNGSYSDFISLGSGYDQSTLTDDGTTYTYTDANVNESITHIVRGDNPAFINGTLPPLTVGMIGSYLDQFTYDVSITASYQLNTGPDDGGDGGYGIYSETLYTGTATFDAAQSNFVPEPGVWALLIVGFGLTGTALRRRRRPALG